MHSIRITPVRLFITSICAIICIAIAIPLVGNQSNQTKTPVIEKSLRTKETNRTLKVGEEFTIELPSNPTTGYRWFMLIYQSPKERWIELVKSEYIPDQPIIIGSGGKEKLTFKAMRPTEAITREFYLNYCGPGGRAAKAKVIPILIKRK